MYLSLTQIKFIGSIERKVVTCEHPQLDIGCGREEVINVISAMIIIHVQMRQTLQLPAVEQSMQRK